MPLINLQTNLKSLKYGDDRPGGANSGQPFLYTAPNIANIDFVYSQNISASYTPKVGANFFDIPTITFDTPTFGYGPSTKAFIFQGKGIDIATPIIKGLDAAAGFVTNGVIGAANKNINVINSTFDTTQTSNNPDFLWRTNRFAIGHAYQDMQRLSKFMTTPSGIFFVIKQELLERQNVKMEGTTRLYNPLGTIAQAGVNFIGYHLNKQGLNPLERSYAKGGNNGYYWNTKNNIGKLGLPNELDTIGRGANRLTTLLLNKINQVNTGFDQYGITGVVNRTELIRYNGGPGAPLGIGFTRISLTDPTRKVELRKEKPLFVNYNTQAIDDYNYLTPEFSFTGPGIAWYYNPFNNTDELGYRSVYSKSIFKLKPSNISFSKFSEQYFGSFNDPNRLLNRNTKTISSSLYAPSTSSAAIGRKGIDPTKPEFYTPTGSSINWTYTAKNGVAQNYFNIVKDEITSTNKTTYFDNIFIGGTPGESKNTNSTNIFSTKKNNTDKDLFTLNGVQIANEASLGKEQNTTFGNTGITDFRSGSFIGVDNKSLIPSTDYTNFNREKTYNISKTSFKGNWKIISEDGTKAQRITNPNEGINSDEVDPNGNFEGTDAIFFRFQVISPDETKLLQFRAYLENWSDGFKGDWTPIKYMGRAENFYKYNGFSREGSITFLVPTLSRLDLANNYKKLNQLVYSVAPSYSQGSKGNELTGASGTTAGLMRGSITRIYMGNYFDGIPTIIRSVDYEQIDLIGWDIDRDQEGKKTGDNLQLPKGIKVTLSFTVLHDFTPQFGETFIGYY